jgi:hypothetical protein
MEVAALLGLSDGPGSVALMGDMAGHATELAGLVPSVEFIGIAPGLRGWEEGEGVSRLNAGVPLPFSSASLRGVGLFAGGAPPAPGEASMPGEASTAGEPSMAGELARVVGRGGRIAVWGGDGGERMVREWETALRSEGLNVLASEEMAVVVTHAAP